MTRRSRQPRISWPGCCGKASPIPPPDNAGHAVFGSRHDHFLKVEDSADQLRDVNHHVTATAIHRIQVGLGLTDPNPT